VGLLSGYAAANVTGARGSIEAAKRLVGDALAVLDVDEARTRVPGRWLDLGTGNGVPGVPLLLALPGLEMTFVDSVRRKCDFVTGVVDGLGLAARARVACARSERLGAVGSADRESYDVVVAKAVGSLATLVELAAPLLAGGGVLLAYKGERAAGAEWAAAEAAGAVCGLGGRRIAPLPRSPLSHSVCAVFEKVAPCPESLPRREGLARSKPLGGARPKPLDG
jgi:16S rRNA (guanine527-N7)-methyltransferase